MRDLPPEIQALEQSFQQPPLMAVQHPVLADKQIQLWLKRTDFLHPVISGNKWYKLKYNLVQAYQQQAAGIVSFGGVWSNHLHALAAACQVLKRPVVAVIRGEPELIEKSQMLQDAERCGMQFHFVSRAEYRLRDDASWQAELMQNYQDYLLVPEGGSSALAEPGLVELGQEVEQQLQAQGIQADQLWCAMGTGGTLAGLLAAQTLPYKVMGMPVLKGGDFLRNEVEQKLKNSVYSPSVTKAAPEFDLITDGHWGGYGKVKPELLDWMQGFYQKTGVLLDPIYTGKLMYRFFQAVEQGQVTEGSQIVMLHSGGLQGRRGFGLSWESEPDRVSLETP